MLLIWLTIGLCHVAFSIYRDGVTLGITMEITTMSIISCALALRGKLISECVCHLSDICL